VTRAVLLVGGLAVVAILPAGPAHAGGKGRVAEGRALLKKANDLAGTGRCDAAIRVYTQAYEKLHEAAVLLNRGECQRRLGRAAPAAADYRAYLAAWPAARNRQEVEAKLAALAAQTAPEGIPRAAAAEPRELAPAATPSAPRPPLAAGPPLLSAPPAAGAADVLLARPAAETPAPDSGNPRRRSWIAIGAAAAVLVVAAGTYLAVRTPGASIPSTDLGNYRF
jgi:hypothetical protein